MMARSFFSFVLGAFCVCAFLFGSCSDKNGQEGATKTVEKSEGPSNAKKPQHASSDLRLNFEGTLILGNTYTREMHHGEFTLKNYGSSVEKLFKVEPTCSCISLDRDYNGTELKPGEELTIGFVMDVSTVPLDSYGREILILPVGLAPIKARVGGYVIKPATILPKEHVDLGLMKNPATAWKQVFQIQGNPDIEQELILGTPEETKNLNLVLEKLGNGNYQLTVTPKGTLPYIREFDAFIFIPILQPKAANELLLEVTAQVAEAVVFAPDKWTIRKSVLKQAESLTERFAYGEVPGLQEERKMGDSASEGKNMLKRSLLKQHNAVPLKFVKENHDWDDLFENIQFRVPQGVTLEKIRHPQGIELKITVTTAAFAETDTIQVVPYRDQNDMSPITIQAVEE